MKRLLLKLMFYFYRKEYHKPLSEIDVDLILTKIATTKGLEDFPRYLSQCSENAKNQYLYSNDEIFKGTILAFVSLRDQILKKRPKRERDLTQDQKNDIMKKRGY